MDLILNAGVGSHTYLFRSGQVTFSQGTLLRVPSFDPAITEYHYEVSPNDTPYKPLNFRSGRITLTAQPYVILTTSTPNHLHQFTGGKSNLTVGSVPEGGALAKFGYWPSTAVGDPAEVLVDSTSPATAGGVGQAWGRPNATLHVGRSAKFMGVGARWPSVPISPTGGVTYKNYTKKVQVEKAHIGGSFPTSYERARQVNVIVRPQRINLVTSVSDVTATTTTGVTFNGASNWTRYTATSNQGGARVLADLISLKNGQTYTVQVEVANDGATAQQVLVDWCDGTVQTYNILPGTSRVVSATGSRVTYDATYRFADFRVPTSGQNILMRNFMIERGAELLPYFDGSSNEDTIWEGTAGASRSHFYKDRVARYAAIKRILEANVPMGIGVGEPVFGTLPADW